MAAPIIPPASIFPYIDKFAELEADDVAFFPSFSHSHAAAKDPIILEANNDFVFTIERDE